MSAPLAASEKSFQDLQNDQVKAYLLRKKRENGNERLRLAKAMQWYFFYGCLFVTGVFLIHNYPKVLNIFNSIQGYIVIVVFYVLMYGIVFVAYTTTPWPYPLLYERAAAIRATNWSTQLRWIEVIMTIIYFTFYIVGDFQRYIFKDLVGAIILVVLQLPHFFCAIIGFPKTLSMQLLGISIRLLGMLFSFCHLLLCFIFFKNLQTLAIASILASLPFSLLIGMYFNGRVDKRPAFFFFGKYRRDFVIIGISIFSFILWEGLLCFMLFIYKSPSYSLTYKWMPISHPFETLVDFLEVMVVGCMAILCIPCMYHSFLKVREVYPKTVNMEPDESTRLINSVDLRIYGSAPANFMDDIALVIACHKSKDNIIKTLHAAHHYAHFPLNNIYIAHNAGAPAPIDETGPVVWENEEFRPVHYIYVPVGNKSIAINYVIENYIRPAGISMMIMIDDDVLFPMDIDLKGGYEQIKNNKKVKAVAYTIRGIENANLWQKYQHMEYMQAGFLKMFQGQFGSVLTCHGAIALWDVKACIKVFGLHNTEFHGEDLQMGIILRKFGKEYRIEANAVGPVATASPKSLLYESDPNEKSLFSQRVFSWDMAAHHFFIDFIKLTFGNWERNGLILKPFLIIELWTMLQDWLRFLFLADIFMTDPITAISLVWVLIIVQTVVILLFDKMILSHRPELQSSFLICATYPLYNILTVLFRFVGLLYNVLYYTPWNPPRVIINERKKLGLIPPAVIEPMGTNEERKIYWDQVWKLDTYTKKEEEQPQQVPPAAEELARVASVAHLVVAAGQLMKKESSVFYELDVVTDAGDDNESVAEGSSDSKEKEKKENEKEEEKEGETKGNDDTPVDVVVNLKERAGNVQKGERDYEVYEREHMEKKSNQWGDTSVTFNPYKGEVKV